MHRLMLAFKDTHQLIDEAAKRAGRDPVSILPVAVSKKQSVEKMKLYEAFCRETGRNAVFGENYAQECVQKSGSLDPSSRVHFIGPLQSNKVRSVVGLCSVIETLDSEKLAAAIDKEASKRSIQQKCYVQINISGEAVKSGIAPEHTVAFLNHLKHYPHIRTAGLMTITRYYPEPEDVREDFRRMRKLFDSVKPEGQEFALSMGMSADFQIAIEEGATEVRIGSALFGSRRS